MVQTNSLQITQGKHRNQFLCPHCNSNARVRTSRRISSLFMDGLLECQNIESCGWRGRYYTEIVATLTQSAAPAFGVNLPISQLALPPLEKAIPKKVIPVLTKNPFDPYKNQIPLFQTLH